ncbi:MAG: hypothetical protein IKU71_02755 [Kiritimatiellae bacterium]|nr:hypothetical protein [Kiritimatiellia bacterium]
MNNFGKFASVLAAVAALFVLGAFAFVWIFCRVYVGPGEMAIVTSKTGDELPPGAILAEPGQKGVQRIPLGEGRHFFNPVTHDWRIVAAITIPAGSVGVVTSKNGRELAPGEILAPDRDSKGVWKDVLGPGRYRLNPEGYDVKVMSAINIPIGYVGVVTSQTGKPAAAGSFAGPGEKGVMEKVLQPGLYYVNPRAYQVDVVEIGMNQVSIVGKSGTVVLTKAQSQSANGLDELQRMTLQKQVQKRAEYVTQNADLGIVDEDSARNFSNLSLNSLSRAPVARKVAGDWSDRKTRGAPAAAAYEASAPAPARANASQSQLANDSVAFGMNQFVQFPSSDGFAIMLDMTVEFELMPEKISKIFMLYGDLPAVVSKIIMPQILSISRMKGSDYKAREFIDGEGRQKFQEEMTAELVRVLGEKHILVRNAIVRHVEVPEEILAPIQSAAVAKEQDLTNKTQQDTEKRRAELNTEVAKVDQLKREVEQETAKLVATVAAEMRKDVAEINAETKLKAAEIDLECAKIQAKITETRGSAEVKAKFLVENEEALGIKRRASAFKDPSLWADLVFADALNPAVNIRVIHSGEGTLWTDLKGASLAVPAQGKK